MELIAANLCQDAGSRKIASPAPARTSRDGSRRNASNGTRRRSCAARRNSIPLSRPRPRTPAHLIRRQHLGKAAAQAVPPARRPARRADSLFQHVERRQAGPHRHRVLAEGRRVDERARDRREDRIADRVGEEHGADRNRNRRSSPWPGRPCRARRRTGVRPGSFPCGTFRSALRRARTMRRACDTSRPRHSGSRAAASARPIRPGSAR